MVSDDLPVPADIDQVVRMKPVLLVSVYAVVDVAKGTDDTCPVDRATLLARFHAREHGRVLSGAAAFAAMWRAIPLLRPIGLAARNRWILAVLEAGYRGFLRLRPSLQWTVRRLRSA